MTRSASPDLDQFYALLGRLAAIPEQGRPLRELPRRSAMPAQGVYFFLEPGEFRATNPQVPRVVRVGTHAVSRGSRTTLRRRLKQHLGTRRGGGNHRGSVFRRHLGDALLARDGTPLPTWGLGSTAPPTLRGDENAAAAEAACEGRVSEYIGAMPVFWIDVSDEASAQSARGYIEKNAVALLSNGRRPIDSASGEWLGRSSPCPEIRDSALWNVTYVTGVCDPGFLDKLEAFVTLTVRAPRDNGL